jgi:hypothetical protein
MNFLLVGGKLAILMLGCATSNFMSLVLYMIDLHIVLAGSRGLIEPESRC